MTKGPPSAQNPPMSITARIPRNSSVIPADVTASEPRTHTTRFSGTVVVSVVIARAYGAALGRTTLCSRVFRQYLCGHEAAQGNAGA